MFDRGAFLGQVRLATHRKLGSTQAMVDVDAGLLDSVQAAVIEFWGNGCPPCEQYKPVFDDVSSQTGADIMMASVNTDDSPGLASHYSIRATPTTIFLATGTELNRVEGKMTKEALIAAIQAAFGAGPTAQAQAAIPDQISQDQAAAAPPAASSQTQPGTPFTKPGPMPPAAQPGTPAAQAPSNGPSKALLIVGGVSLVALVTGGLLLAKA